LTESISASIWEAQFPKGFYSKQRQFLQKLNLILISVKENTKTFFDLSSEEFTIAGVEPGKYVLILLSNPEKNSPQPIFSANFVFDTRLVEVSRGRATRNVDFQITESAEKKSGPSKTRKDGLTLDTPDAKDSTFVIVKWKFEGRLSR
jgi:hypothetical protein